MLNVRCWIGAASVPILLFSCGCSIGLRPFSTSQAALPPERLMSIAKTFERQGHPQQAQNTYLQVLAINPNFPRAQESLDILVANEANKQRRRTIESATSDPNQLLSQSKPIGTRSALTQQLPTSPKIASPIRVVPLETVVSATADPVLSTTSLESASSSVPPSPSLPDNPKLLITEEGAPPKVSSASASFETVSERIDRPSNLIIHLVLPALAPTPAQSSPTLSDNDSPEKTISASVPELAPINQTDDIGSLDIGDNQETFTQVPIPEPSESPQEIAAQEQDDFSEEQILLDTLQPQSTMPAPIEVVSKDHGNNSDSIRFEMPVIWKTPTADAELVQFLGPFHKEMVEILRTNREEFQPVLAKLAADQESETSHRARAIFLLGTLGPAAREVIPVLRRELQYDLDGSLRIDLAEAILKIHPADERAIQVLIESLNDSNENVRWLSAFALRNAAADRREYVIDSLIESAKTNNQKFRRMAFLTLAEFGPVAVKAVPEIEAALNSPDPATRKVAKASLACIAP